MFDWSVLAPVEGGPDLKLDRRIERLIIDGVIGPGERIPAERELSSLLRTSRASVRDSLRDLEMRGLLDRKPGRGTIVTIPDRPELSSGILSTNNGSERVLREVMDLRAVMEPPIAERAAIRRTPAELKDLLRIVEESERSLQSSELNNAGLRTLMVELDIEFHTAIAGCTQNPMLERLLKVTNDWMAPSRGSALQSTLRMRQSVAAHRLIYEAIAANDPGRARQAMELHIQEVLERIGIQDGF